MIRWRSRPISNRVKIDARSGVKACTNEAGYTLLAKSPSKTLLGIVNTSFINFAGGNKNYSSTTKQFQNKTISNPQAELSQILRVCKGKDQFISYEDDATPVIFMLFMLSEYVVMNIRVTHNLSMVWNHALLAI